MPRQEITTACCVARLRSDITLAQFEGSVRDLVRDVVINYWELYFGYRDLDTKITVRDAAREVWENRKLRLDNGVGRPDDEAEARRQYFDFQLQAQLALAGLQNGQPGVLGADRNLRRLLGLPVQNGDIIRPITEPDTAPIVFDWQDSQIQALGRRVELRQQKWAIRQRELELIAARQLKKWQFDFVADYGAAVLVPTCLVQAVQLPRAAMSMIGRLALNTAALLEIARLIWPFAMPN